ncbi:MAG: hypothetical protein BMS9Abin32_449 [Gammaproteobacteria bacterium]|nr:MAG: hypothetical protein BMS9Abin32_449 [Gammaproteobacteria bacterium]
MKAARIIAAGLLLIIVAGLTAWTLRDRLVLRLANPLLRDYGMTLTDVSLDALGSRDASIGQAVLRHESGAVLRISGLRLPLRAAATRSISAQTVSVTFTDNGVPQQMAMAALLSQVLSLPAELPQTEILLARLEIPPYPAAENLVWRSNDGNQALSATFGGFDLQADIKRNAVGGYAMTLTMGDWAMALDISPQDSGISLSGSMQLDLPAGYALLQTLLQTPPAVTVVSGTAELRIDATLPSGATQPVRAVLGITPVTPFEIRYAPPAGELMQIRMDPGNPLTVELQLPGLGWNMAQARSRWLVSTGAWQELPITLTNVACRSGPSCAFNMEISADRQQLGIGNAATLQLTASQTWSLHDATVSLQLQPGATLALTGLRAPGFTAERVSARLAAPANLELDARGWRLDTESIAATIQGIDSGAGASIDLQLALDSLDAGIMDGQLSASLYLESAQPSLRWRDYRIPLPALSGSLAVQGKDLLARLSLVEPGREEGLFIRISHDLQSQAGRLLLQNAALDFARRPLSKRIVPWPYALDISGGNLLGELQLAWTGAAAADGFAAQAWITLSQLAGRYGDTAFTGLDSRITAHYAAASGLRLEPVTVTVGLLDFGLPVEDLIAVLKPDLQRRAVQVDKLHMQAFGGVILAEPFSYDSAADSNTLTVRAESIELVQLLTLQEFANIELSGAIAATLPVTVTGNGVSITGGKLSGEPPGGVIRYLPGLAGSDASASNIDLVIRALSNFEYETLESDVSYSETGDLQLQMQLTGRNPDLDRGRPVVLNLGVENNMPQMLKSLQAMRAVEEVLQRGTKQ